MEWIYSPEAWIALVTLTSLEIVLGIDNIIFITILAGRLPEHERRKGRVLGLALAMIMRILLLFSLAWVLKLTNPLVYIYDLAISGRDLILISGGLFLLAKSTHEIHASLEMVENGNGRKEAKTVSFMSCLVQIGLIDVVFSLDSVITAVGLAKDLPVMVIAIVISVIIMMLSANSIGNFVERHPTVKMLALSFLILIGVTLLAEGLSFHIPKGYVYFAMAFSFVVEILNIKMVSRKYRSVRLGKQI